MRTIYFDFDNTMVETNRRIIEILNKKYNLSKTEADLTDLDYISIAPITKDEKVKILESDEFFSNLSFKDGFLAMLNKYCDKFHFVVIAKGTEESLKKKEKWVKNNVPFSVGFVKISESSLCKKNIYKKGCIQIASNIDLLNTNAEMKILYKSGNKFDWQTDYTNTDILVADTWSQIDDILSFYSLYDYTTLDIIN